MALNQKYTWADFLSANPDKKGIKRTSAEGKKAFDAAYRARIKEYLKQRVELLEKQQTKAKTARDELVGRLKATKKPSVAKRFQERVGQKDHTIAFIGKQIERTKASTKQV